MSIERFLKICDQVDTNDRAWLLRAFEEWKSGTRFDLALGLCGSDAVTYRNMLLNKAANILNTGNGYTTWHVAGMLAKAITRFESRVLPRYEENGNISLSEIDQVLVHLFTSGKSCRVIRTREHIYNCIK